MRYQDKVRDILANMDRYHRAYYESEAFSGPSLYFHRRALETRQPSGSLAHLEYVYATLASWGMHRMGKGGSKMKSFEDFRRSTKLLTDKISQAQRFDCRAMDNPKWILVGEIFKEIEVMASGTSLVGNSKALHHIMPNIVPPIDREYTLRYLRGNTNIKNDLDQEWLSLKEIVSDFFIPIACHTDFHLMANQWVSSQDKYPWDTSVLKVVDNLLIGWKKWSAQPVAGAGAQARVPLSGRSRRIGA